MNQRFVFVMLVILTLGLNVGISAEELLNNGDFGNGSNRWNLQTISGASAEVTSMPSAGPNRSPALRITVSKAGTQNWHVQFLQTGLRIIKGESYKIRFYAKTITGLKPNIAIQQNHSPWSNSSPWYAPKLTSRWQKFTYEFIPNSSDDKVRFIIGNLGLTTGSLDLACVSVLGPDSHYNSEEMIHVNQLGYHPDAEKKAVFANMEGDFEIVRDADGQVVYDGSTVFGRDDQEVSGDKVHYADFTPVTSSGFYHIECAGIKSPSFEINPNVYLNVTDALLKALFFQRCGVTLLPEHAGPWHHDVCHDFPGQLYVDDKKAGMDKEARGGWHDAGDYNRYTTPAAVTIGHMMLLHEMYPLSYRDDLNIPETSNGISDLLDEIRWGLEWVLKMQDSQDGGVYHKLAKRKFTGSIMPEFDLGQMLFTPKSSHATGDLAAVCAWGSRLFASLDPSFADELQTAAEHAWHWLVTTPGPARVENPPGVSTGAYGDTNYRDEQYWAAVQLYALTGETQYLDFIKNNHHAAPKGYGWRSVGTFGDVGYLLLPSEMQDVAVTNTLSKRLSDRATSVLNTSNTDAYRIGLKEYNYGWGSNMTVGTKAIDLLVENYFNPSTLLVAVAYDHIHYLLGRNAVGTSFVSGYGTVAMRHPHHRPSKADGVKNPVPGLVSGGPNRNPSDSAAKHVEGNLPAKSWIDVYESYSMNEITTYWNSPFIFVFGAIEVLSKEQEH